MNQNDKIRNALESMVNSRAGLEEARRRVENAEVSVGKCEAEAFRQVHLNGGKPILFRGVMYSVEHASKDQLDILQEKRMDFTDLTEKE